MVGMTSVILHQIGYGQGPYIGSTLSLSCVDMVTGECVVSKFWSENCFDNPRVDVQNK